MGLTRPTLLSMVAFDAKKQQKFTFIITGNSSQIVANKLIIRNNNTNDIVYEEKQETFKYEHIVNADELTNGVYYNAVLSVFDVNGNESISSIPIQFWGYETPTIEISNIPVNNIINNSSFNFQFLYNQSQNESLNSYIINLYNSSKVQISTSGVQYTLIGIPPYTGNYTFTGFENNTIYYIQVLGTTIEGTVISSELKQFTVQYTRPDLFTLIELTNNCDEGYISISSNIVLIDGDSQPSPPIYIENEEIDLTANDSYVQWKKGFSISGDFLSRLWFRNPNPYQTIAQFSNASGEIIKLNYMQGYESIESTDMGAYVEIYVSSITGVSYYIFSNYVPILPPTEKYVVYLTKNNNVYSLQLLTTT